MINVVIVEDEDWARNDLQKMLLENLPELTVTGIAVSKNDALRIIIEKAPDLVFMDIDLGDGDAFELIEELMIKIPFFQFRVIFTTGLNEFAIKAFKFNAVDYLLKPVKVDELVLSVRKYSEISYLERQKHLLDTLMNNLKYENSENRNIVLSNSDGVFVYKVNEIIRCEAQRNYSLFHFTSGDTLLISKTLRDFEDMLVEFGFERIHHSHLVNLAHIKKFHRGDRLLTMSDQAIIPVSESKKEELLELLKRGRRY